VGFLILRSAAGRRSHSRVKEIAAQLGISAKTVEAHASAVLRKLQLSAATS
jgi:DNA-binding NarL/FixJ family response regulator